MAGLAPGPPQRASRTVSVAAFFAASTLGVPAAAAARWPAATLWADRTALRSAVLRPSMMLLRVCSRETQVWVAMPTMALAGSRASLRLERSR